MKLFLNWIFLFEEAVGCGAVVFGLAGARRGGSEVELVRFVVVFVEEEYSFGCEVVDSCDFGSLLGRRITSRRERLRL